MFQNLIENYLLPSSLLHIQNSCKFRNHSENFLELYAECIKWCRSTKQKKKGLQNVEKTKFCFLMKMSIH